MPVQWSLLGDRAKLAFLVLMFAAANSYASGSVEKVIHKFTGSPDGRTPSGALVADKDGNLYGTAEFGGIPGGGGENIGFGVVFELSPPAVQGGDWTETILYKFTDGSDGANPSGTLIFDDQGNLYGGRNGGLFELSPPDTQGGAWTETNLPSPGLQQGSRLLFYLGKFFGVTQDGGTANKGTAFVLTRPTKIGGAWTYRVLHNFGVAVGDGTVPMAGLALHNGSLYGTTNQGGAHADGYGTVFRLTPKNGVWTYSILYDFTAEDTEGVFPYGPLIFDGPGNLYGTTYQRAAFESGSWWGL